MKNGNGSRRQHASVTASEEARHAGVSAMTVSRVVNGERNVRDATREKVKRAIEELNYSPNKAARSLASARHMKIGVLYSDPSSTYLSLMMIGLLERARQSDTQIVIVECASDSAAIGIINDMVKEGVDGMILAPPLCDSATVFGILNRHRVPAVTVGSQHEDERISSVSVDDYRAAQVMTRHLIDLGHRRIAFIIGNPGQSASRLRLAGYRDALAGAGIDIAEELIVQGQFSYQSGLDSAARLLSLPEIPSAVMASNDDMAAGVIATAQRYRIDVPEQPTVCGFDDTMFARTIRPEITTIQQPISEISKAAIELLERNIRRHDSGAEIERYRLMLDFQLMRRQSDAPPCNPPLSRVRDAEN
jgi:LacI family transcriptional regulator